MYKKRIFLQDNHYVYRCRCLKCGDVLNLDNVEQGSVKYCSCKNIYFAKSGPEVDWFVRAHEMEDEDNYEDLITLRDMGMDCCNCAHCSDVLNTRPPLCKCLLDGKYYSNHTCEHFT